MGACAVMFCGWPTRKRDRQQQSEASVALRRYLRSVHGGPWVAGDVLVDIVSEYALRSWSGAAAGALSSFRC